MIFAAVTFDTNFQILSCFNSFSVAVNATYFLCNSALAVGIDEGVDKDKGAERGGGIR